WVLAIDPVSFLVAPRFIGVGVTLVLSTIFADLLACVKLTKEVQPRPKQNQTNTDRNQ
ncbi:MAG: ABC transporter permease, partial [Caldiserica bacterium]|nr:ABC transporter permease [Caldisericota bacterium]